MNMKTSDQIRDFLQANTREFGQTGWMIPVASFGGAALSGEGGGYGFGDVSKSEAQELVSHAIDIGIKLFDTAPIYGFGLSEQRLGEFLKGKRDQVYIATKSGVTWSSSKRVNMTNDPQVAEEMLLQSLKDLRTDYIDLYLIHWPDAKVDIRSPLEILAKYQSKGVIRKIGLCNTNLEDLNKAKEITRIDVIQSEYNIFNRSAEAEIFPYCEKNQCAFMAWGPLDKGALTGNYDLKRTYDDSDARKSAPWFKKSDLEKKVHQVEKLKFLLPENVSMIEMINSFYLSQRCLSTILVGSKSSAKLDEFIASMMKGAQLWQNIKNKTEFLALAGNWNK
jgi:myo-inositol catabolism protein IolS